MIRVVCGCGRVFKAEQRHSGKRTRCPVCGASLIIGQTPAPSSGTDRDEVPSRWYPIDSREPSGEEGTPPVRGGDPESIRTAILPPVPTAGMAAGRGPMVAHEGRGDRPVPGAGPDRAGRRAWVMAGAGAAAVMVIGMACWMRTTPPGRGDVMAARAPEDAPPRPFDRNGWPDGPADGSRPARTARRLRLLVPAYIYPTGEGRQQWLRLMDAASRVDLVAIVNPNTGPGLERNPDYASTIAEAAGRGVKLVGYVTTRYAERRPSEVKGDIDAWVRFYPGIAGFFLDQQPRDAGRSAYLADIGAHARAKLPNALVIANPGVPCDASYLARRASDVVCVYANYTGFDPFELPAALKEYGPSRFAAMVYQVADAEVMRGMLKEAIIKRIGYVYVTDGKPPNPWGRLPAYWEAEVEALTRIH